MKQFKVINKTGKELHTTVTLHPGEVIAGELEARGLKKSAFAKGLGVRPGHLSDLLGGKRHVSAATAIRLEKELGINAEYWLRLQMHYDLQIERDKLNKAA